MTETELQKILFALKLVFGEQEARRIFIKLAHILFD
jgi:hypothetical protein